MGLFSFGSKEKKEQPRRAEPDTMTSLALQQNLGNANLDYLLEVYAPDAWQMLNGIFEMTHHGMLNIYDRTDTIMENQGKIMSRLDEISRRLDALEQRTQDLPQRER